MSKINGELTTADILNPGPSEGDINELRRMAEQKARESEQEVDVAISNSNLEDSLKNKPKVIDYTALNADADLSDKEKQKLRDVIIDSASLAENLDNVASKIDIKESKGAFGEISEQMQTDVYKNPIVHMYNKIKASAQSLLNLAQTSSNELDKINLLREQDNINDINLVRMEERMERQEADEVEQRELKAKQVAELQSANKPTEPKVA